VYIDTHAHLDLEQFDDVADVIRDAESNGVRGIVNIGFGPDRWESTLELTRRFSGVACTLGFHPGDSDQFNPESLARLRTLLETTSPVGIGEAGIDLHWPNNPPLEIQKRVFMAQIDLAIEFDLPLVIHQRSAEDEVAGILARASEQLRVVLHSFDGTERLFGLAAERGWFIGVGGLMTRRSASVRTLLQNVPLDRFVLETDSPFLVPAGIQERRNTPSNIPLIAERFAALRGVSLETVQQRALENSIAAFPRLASVLKEKIA
jgi:TatD DNase family protein